MERVGGFEGELEAVLELSSLGIPEFVLFRRAALAFFTLCASNFARCHLITGLIYNAASAWFIQPASLSQQFLHACLAPQMPETRAWHPTAASAHPTQPVSPWLLGS